MRFQGKTVIVTGAGAGIGRAISKAFALEGARVALWDINGQAAGEAAREISSEGGEAFSRQVDVSMAGQVEEAFQDLLSRWKSIDVLVNNAGICLLGSIETIDERDWDRVMEVNLKSVFLCSRAVMGAMKAQGKGCIINMGSIAGKVGGIAVGAHYSASKAAVMCLTKSLAKELAPYGVRVNGVCPGVVETDMTRMITKGDWSSYVSQIPMGRVGNAWEVARAVLFLASEEASYITGEILDINGGQLMD
ncbi:MAG: SDR family NAD(P)-dependent oxidoreductase [bacterium]